MVAPLGMRLTTSSNAGRVVAALLVCLLVTMAGETHAERLPIKSYTTADGLPRDRINRIVQDSRGFLWFCTSEGLSRFDGYGFTNYGIEQGLPGREVNDFLETRTGAYWVATDKGLCRFNPEPTRRANESGSSGASARFEVYLPGQPAAANQILVILEDHTGTIWCGTATGLFRLDQIGGQPVISFVDAVGQGVTGEKRAVRAIIEDSQNCLWVGSDAALYRLRPNGNVERYTEEEGLVLNGIGRALLQDREGKIWVGTTTGLYELVRDPQLHSSVVQRLYTKEDGLADNFVNALYESAEGTLWVASGPGLSEFLPALNKADGGRFQSYTSDNGLDGASVTTLTQDRDHNLWIGTAFSGALRLAASGFTTYSTADGLGGAAIASIFEDRAGELCVLSSAYTLNRFAGGRFKACQLTLPKGMKYWGWGWYQVLFQDSRGEWWMNTGEGLARYAGLTSVEQIGHARPKAVYTTKNGLPANEIFRLFEDSHGDIWISTLGNPNGVLTRWERATETFIHYTPADGVSEDAPTAFCEDGAGNLWIGLYNTGLLRYSAGRFTHFTEADGAPLGFIRGLYLDHAGRLWVASGERGVARVDRPNDERPTFVTYSINEGLSSSQATCVTEDQWGMIYIGTGRGVDKLDPATGHIKHYSTPEGLASSFVNVGFRQRDGSLWFGTLQGLSRLVPQAEHPASAPAIYINHLTIAGDPHPISELGATEMAGLEVSPNRNNVEISFSGLSLAVGESLRYQYKLEGASSDWSAPTNQRSVSYPNLPPGSYRFVVRAVGADGELSESPATVSFRVLPPVWRRWWFISVVALIVAAAILSFERNRAGRVRVLSESENRYRALAETASDAIFTIDDSGKIAFVNPAVERMFGCSSSDLVGRDVSELIPGYRHSLRMAGLDAEALDTSWEAREVFGVYNGGSKIPLELSFGSFERDNRRFVTLIARDVTERKRAEEALRRSREERLAELERVRRRIATDLHDDIGSSLTQISILSEVMRRNAGADDSPTSEPLKMIARSSRELVDAMSDIVWAINPQKDQLSDLTQRMRRFASDVFTARNIAFDLRLPPVDLDVKLGANLRREVFLIFKESINNMVRHSECSRADIEFGLAQDHLYLRLSDDGTGFDTSQQSDGHGLMSMRERARDVGGQLEITSARGQGTTIRLKVPLDHSTQTDIQ